MPLVNNGHDSGVTTSSLHVSPLAFSDAGLYTVVVSNPCGTVTNHVRLVVTLPLVVAMGLVERRPIG